MFILMICCGYQTVREVDSQEILDYPVLINLGRCPHRFNETRQHMMTAGFTNIQRFEAVDGIKVHPSVFQELGIYTGSPGEKGCAASHLLVWEAFIADSDREFLFVAEDDLLPHTDFACLFPLYWEKTPKDFDIVLVGNRMPTTTLHKEENLVVSIPSYCTHAYIISQKGARKLLALYKQIPQKTKSLHVIDHFLIDLMRRKAICYYCYNGILFPDTYNFKAGNVLKGKATGICFQNAHLEGTIGSRA